MSGYTNVPTDRLEGTPLEIRGEKKISQNRYKDCSGGLGRAAGWAGWREGSFTARDRFNIGKGRGELKHGAVREGADTPGWKGKERPFGRQR